MMEGLSKIDVARRQLAEAIRLFFEQRDSIAVHTLASAAQGVLRDLAANQEPEHHSILHDNPLVKDGNRKLWIDHLNQARNYFKHADRDSNVSLLWEEENNEQWLLDGVLLYMTLKGEFFNQGTIYLGWITTKYPQLRSAVSGNVVGDFCSNEGISYQDFAWFLEHLDARILIGKRDL